MIYPGRRAIIGAAAIAPLALLIGVAAPGAWWLGLVAVAMLILAIAADGALATRMKLTPPIVDLPRAISVGADFTAEVHVAFERAHPAQLGVALGSSALVSADQPRQTLRLAGAAGAASVGFVACRRGRSAMGPLWLRWSGPLGLAWKQEERSVDQHVLVTPDIRPVLQRSAQIIHRDATFGLAPQSQRGEGTEFEALSEYRQGMDRRWIDWKQSARHTTLLAKEYRTERNNNVIMAIDAGRVMCEPLAGLPRVDRAVSAALLTAFVALRDGDRVGFFGFDSHPRVASNAVSGERSFALLQRIAADIDYSPNETNYTLALATLGERLHRRSLVVVFTEFADTVSAELMLQAVATLLDRHLVLFVVLRDEELEELAEAEPETPAHVTRAVTAAALLRERQLVIARLRRLGVNVIEAGHDQAGPALVSAYLDIKRRSLL